MWFLSRAQIITAIGAIVLALYVLDLVRRRKLAEEYSLLWVAATLVVAVLGISTPLLRTITHALGILYEGSTVFFLGLAFATSMLLYLSVKLSRLGHDNQELTREIAFLRREIDLLRGAGGHSGREGV